MLDNLRDQASSSAYFQEEEAPAFEAQPAVEAPRGGRRTIDQITGMTAQQRFIIVAMLLVMACLVGAMFLVIAGKVVLPVF
jgi:uncharacterized membrane protein